MRISEILLGIAENPFSPRYYKELMQHYRAAGMNHEAEAVDHLMRAKFHEKTDGRRGGEKQPGYDS